jgi:hypothetical protein
MLIDLTGDGFWFSFAHNPGTLTLYTLRHRDGAGADGLVQPEGEDNPLPVRVVDTNYSNDLELLATEIPFPTEAKISTVVSDEACNAKANATFRISYRDSFQVPGEGPSRDIEIYRDDGTSLGFVLVPEPR